MNQSNLKDIYNKLYRFYGPQGWWPAHTRFEVIVGAILTQNTAWTNVEKAIRNLKKAKVLKPVKMKRADARTIAKLIKPSGYYNIKSKRLRNFMNFLFDGYNGSLKNISAQKTDKLRRELLAVNGIGPETCDSILLYAFQKPVFVVDAYTKRIFSRHGFFREEATYDEVQQFFMTKLPKDTKLYNEYHALIVRLGKEFCKKRPSCKMCPIRKVR